MSGDYVLGSHADELARLEAQSAAIEQPTRLVLQAAGIGSGMHVLDLGSGLGHVSQLVASLVGPEGSVVGVEQSPELLQAAERRRTDAGLDRVSFVQGDVRAFDAGRTFDAVVGRLILFHLADPVAVGDVLHVLGSDSNIWGGAFDVDNTSNGPGVDFHKRQFAAVEPFVNEAERPASERRMIRVVGRCAVNFADRRRMQAAYAVCLQ